MRYIYLEGACSRVAMGGAEGWVRVAREWNPLTALQFVERVASLPRPN